MINTFVLCKNEVFFRTIEKELNKNHICCLDIFKDPETALEQYKKIRTKPDIILLDANWKKYITADATIIKQFKNTDSPPKIILVTNYYDELIADKLKELNVQGYFYRNVENVKTVIDCIKQVYKGKEYFISKPNDLPDEKN